MVNEKVDHFPNSNAPSMLLSLENNSYSSSAGQQDGIQCKTSCTVGFYTFKVPEKGNFIGF